MAQVRVLIADDETQFREALGELLAREPDLQIVALCPNGSEALALIESLHYRPDVVLTDLRMPKMDGIELTRMVKEKLPQTAVVILTSYDDDDNLFGAIKAGAIGYVLKDAPTAQTVEAIHAAAAGEGYLSPGLMLRVMNEFKRIDQMARGQRELFTQLTRREHEVLERLATGLRNKEIAIQLQLAEKTVRNHISTILGKLHVNDRTEAALIASRHGLGAKPPREPNP